MGLFSKPLLYSLFLLSLSLQPSKITQNQNPPNPNSHVLCNNYTLWCCCCCCNSLRIGTCTIVKSISDIMASYINGLLNFLFVTLYVKFSNQNQILKAFFICFAKEKVKSFFFSFSKRKNYYKEDPCLIWWLYKLKLTL